MLLVILCFVALVCGQFEKTVRQRRGVTEIVRGSSGASWSSAAVPALQSPPVAHQPVWQVNNTIAIYNAASFSGTSVFASMGSNDPLLAAAQETSLSGSGRVTAEFKGSFQVGSFGHTIPVAVQSRLGVDHADVVQWTNGLANKPTNFTVPGVIVPVNGAEFARNADGSTDLFATLIVHRGGCIVYFFEAGHAQPLGHIAESTPDGCRNVKLSSGHGTTAQPTRAALVVGKGVCLYEVTGSSGQARTVHKLGCTTPEEYDVPALCISADGAVIGHGFETMAFYRWNGHTLGVLKKFAAPGPSMAMACDGAFDVKATGGQQLFAVAYDDTSYKGYHVVTFKVSASGDSVDQVAAFTSKSETGSIYQDAVQRVRFSGTRFVVCSWGDSQGTAPTVRVFDGASAGPTLQPEREFHTPGSPMECDLMYRGADWFVTSAGKAVHANKMGRGGHWALWKF